MKRAITVDVQDYNSTRSCKQNIVSAARTRVLDLCSFSAAATLLQFVGIIRTSSCVGTLRCWKDRWMYLQWDSGYIL